MQTNPSFLPYNTPRKRSLKQSLLGTISLLCWLPVPPFIGAIYHFADSHPHSTFDQVAELATIVLFFLTTTAGVTTGVLGILQSRRSRFSAIIGTFLHLPFLLWLCLVVFLNLV